MYKYKKRDLSTTQLLCYNYIAIQKYQHFLDLICKINKDLLSKGFKSCFKLSVDFALRIIS